MMDSRTIFFQVIYEHYSDQAKGKIPDETVKDVSEHVCDYYYEQYTRFGKQYPKSRKRYSSFQQKDLTHPTTFEIVIKSLKNQLGDDYTHCAIALLKMTESELRSFEKSREEFYKMY